MERRQSGIVPGRTVPGHTVESTWRCRLLGHLVGFHATQEQMTWECDRGCGTLGTKLYPTAAEASRYAASFNRRDSDQLGRRAPLLGMWPLRLWHRLRHDSSSPRA